MNWCWYTSMSNSLNRPGHLPVRGERLIATMDQRKYDSGGYTQPWVETRGRLTGVRGGKPRS
jgi:hypothetical protein